MANGIGSSRFVIAALLVGAMVGSAAQIAVPAPAAAPDWRSAPGCVLRQPGAAARFVVTGSLDRPAIARAIAADPRAARSPVVDPCLTSQQRSLPAGMYKALADRAPARFAQPEGLVRQGVGPPPAAAARSVPQYDYVSVTSQIVPPFVFFDVAGISRGAAFVGTAYREEPDGSWRPFVAFLERGRLRVVGEGFAWFVNAGGTIGGDVIIDADNFYTQATLFQPGGRTTPIPLRPGEVTSTVIGLADSGEALVLGFDSDFNAYVSVWDGTSLRPVDFGPQVAFAFLLQMNGRGLISGTTLLGAHYVGFRHDWRSGATTLLYPLPSEPEAWAMGINSRGDVLGYSFVFGSTERIGAWDAEGRFQTYFVQGTPEVPTISNRLRFNASNQIVITDVTRPAAEAGRSYLVPRPGLRVDLADHVAGMGPEAGSLWLVLGISDVGHMFGLTSTFEPFGLLRAGR